MHKRRIVGFLAVVIAMALIGCGGGGGGFFTTSTTATTSTTSTTSGLDLTYTTNWTAESASPTGQSARIRLLNENGGVITQRVVNNSGSTQTVTLTDVPTGFYTVETQLFSGSNATGSVTGFLETVVQGQTTVQTTVGAPLTDIKVTPTAQSLVVGDTQQMAVAGLTANGALTFLAPNSITWSATGAVSVSADGVVTANVAGTGTVTATHTSGATDSTTITVTTVSANRSKWTVMVFLNAANDLYGFAPPDINEMERVAGNSQVRFVVQWKQVQGVGGNANPLFSGTRRYLIKPDTSSTIVSEVVQSLGVNVDMGRPETLNEFVDWTKQNFPADRYCLIVWNHGNGWHREPEQPGRVRGVSYDDHTGHAIQTWQLPTAMQGQSVDVFSFDACLMQMLEVISELQPYAPYVVASEENTPGYGYPYHVIFGPWTQNPAASTRDLTKTFVDGHTGYQSYQNDVITQSSVDSSRVDELLTAVDHLAAALIANRNDLTTIAPNIRNNSMKYAFRGDGRYYYDLWDIANRLQSANTAASIKTAAAEVKTAVEAAVVWNGFTPLSAGSHGISIDFSPANAFAQYQTDYSLTRLARETRWDEWLAVAP